MDDDSVELYDDEAQIEMGQSDSKGAKRKADGAKTSKGVATSFGFRRRPASSSRVDDTIGRDFDTNGNGDSSEDLYVEEADVLCGRSTPLARPRKEATGVPLRTNRFGFRQSGGGKARVGDLYLTAEEAFSGKDKFSAYNNNASDRTSTNVGVPPTTQVVTTQPASVVGVAGVPKTYSKQTVILTYQTQQIPSQPQRSAVRYAGTRSSSASRVSSYETGAARGKYTFHTNQLPRPQYPAVKVLDNKSAKQIANNSRKISGSSDGSREGSATDSGVSTGGDCGGDSSRARRRPRNLEMVMKNAHSFHLRELSVPDLDIMDEAVITEVALIPLPKLDIQYEEELKQDLIYVVPPALTIKGRAPLAMDECSPHSTPERSTLDRYRNRSRSGRISREWDEEKFVLDRAQPEKLDKQNSFIKTAVPDSPPTVNSSKDTSPSCKSDVATETWNNDAAGEAMATRSQDDISYHTSSVEEERSKTDVAPPPTVPRKTIVIADEPGVPHPLLMKSLNTSQQDALRASMMTSMSSSNYSGMSVSTTSSDAQNQTLTVDDHNFDLAAALENSAISLLDDETSPVDSLISSTSNSDSHNDLANLERDVGSLSSSAYQTANTKTKSSNFRMDEYAVDAVVESAKEPEQSVSKNVSPRTPGTPTHASGSLSLSDGRDFFDDEIADQPGLLSMLRKNNEESPTDRDNTDSDRPKSLRKSQEQIASPHMQRGRRARAPGAGRTPSLDTLSSLGSDDMMMDNELGLSVTSLHSVDDYIERLDSSFRSGLNSLNEQQLRAELSTSRRSAVQQWNQLLEQSNALDKQLAAPPPLQRTNATCTSLSEIQASLPVRTARLLQRSRAQTPAAEAAPEAASPPPAAALLQDVVDIKTLLLQLKRVLHESETLDPLLGVIADLPARVNGRRLPSYSATGVIPPPIDHTAELRRQIIFLQSQLEERDRLVRMLQQQMSKLTDPAMPSTQDETCNVATQTERLRAPVNHASSVENPGLVSLHLGADLRTHVRPLTQDLKLE